jgi:hypothetical protein
MNKATLIKTTSSGDAVTLDCKRQYICLTNDGSCEKMVEPTKIKVKTEEDVYRALATDLTDCWWMFGEGKTNYLSKELLSNMYCSICSNIVFDDSVNKIIPSNEIDKKTLYEYMASHQMPEKSVSYFEYLYGTNDLNYIFGDALSKGVSLGKMNLNEQYLSMTAVSSKINKVTWFFVGAGIVAGLAILAPIVGVSVPIVYVLVAAGGAGIAGSTVVAPLVDTFYGANAMPPFFIGINSQELEEFKNLGCKDIETSS